MSNNTEQRILVAMRKTLAAIVRDTTPQPGMRHPLKETTIEDIRACFSLIAARERELAEQAGISLDEKPRYIDEPKKTTVIPFSDLKKPKPDSDS